MLCRLGLMISASQCHSHVLHSSPFAQFGHLCQTFQAKELIMITQFSYMLLRCIEQLHTFTWCVRHYEHMMHKHGMCLRKSLHLLHK